MTPRSGAFEGLRDRALVIALGDVRVRCRCDDLIRMKLARDGVERVGEDEWTAVGRRLLAFM